EWISSYHFHVKARSGLRRSVTLLPPTGTIISLLTSAPLTLFREMRGQVTRRHRERLGQPDRNECSESTCASRDQRGAYTLGLQNQLAGWRSEEHTSELQSRGHLVCRLLLEKKKK